MATHCLHQRRFGAERLRRVRSMGWTLRLSPLGGAPAPREASELALDTRRFQIQGEYFIFCTYIYLEEPKKKKRDFKGIWMRKGQQELR